MKKMLFFLVFSFAAIGICRAESVVGHSSLDMGKLAPVKANGNLIGRQYTIKKGDTLWDIAGLYYRNSFLWPRLWHENIFIDNPNLIYPGDVLLLPVKQQKIQSVRQEMPPGVMRQEVRLVPAEKTDLVLPDKIRTTPEKPKRDARWIPKRKIDLDTIKSTGYIQTSNRLMKNGTVIASMDGRIMIGENDRLYVKPDSEVTYVPGDRLIVFRREKEIQHPTTGKLFGNLVKLLGVLEIEDGKKELKVARVKESYNYIITGDMLAPEESLIDNLLFDAVGNGEEAARQNGMIVAINDQKEGSAQFDIVYLDIGDNSGVLPGDDYVIVRNNRQPLKKLVSSEISIEGKVIGELEILSVQGSSSVARITKSLDMIFRGDFVEKSQKP